MSDKIKSNHTLNERKKFSTSQFVINTKINYRKDHYVGYVKNKRKI